MQKFFRVTTALIGILLAIIGVRWAVVPFAAAAELYLELPDDPLARSTLIGDFSAFFLAGAAMCFMGALKQQAIWNYSCALLIGGAALFRTLAYFFHGAGLPYELIAVEIIVAIVLVLAGVTMRPDRRSGYRGNSIYGSEV